jgi:PAS domain S-box-containing protein
VADSNGILRKRDRYPWLAIGVLVVCLAGTVVTWLQVQANETEHVRRVTKLVGAAVSADATADADAWVLALVRLAKVWEVDDPSRSQWDANADLYIQHHPGCLAIELLDVSRQQESIVNAAGTATGRISASGLRARQQVLDTAAHLNKPISGPFVAEDGANQWMTAIAVYRKQQFQGYLLAVFDLAQSVDTMADDVKGLGFSISVGPPGRAHTALPGSRSQYEAELGQTAGVDLLGVPWELRVWPKPEALDEMRSSMPESTLVMGGLLSLLLSLTIFFAQSTAAKSGRLQEANQRLRAENMERQRVEEALRASQARFAGILEISADAVISTDEQQRVTLYNQGAEKIFGYQAKEVLGQPLAMLIPKRLRETHRTHIARFAQSDQQTMLMSEHTRLYGLRKDGAEFRMVGSVTKLVIGGETIFTSMLRDVTDSIRTAEELRKAHDGLELRVKERTTELVSANQALQTEIAERNRLNDSLKQLSERITRLQDEERRRIARELHDGTLQDMAAVALNLNLLRERVAPTDHVYHGLSDCLRLVQQSAGDLRTISYLLHPPVLEELGLSRTLQSYVEGFRRRSGISLSLQLGPHLGHLPKNVELTIFRIVQESLCNIHRHSDSATASILLVRKDDGILLEVADRGRGIPEHIERPGVGIAGMRERVRLLGGELQVQSGSGGTTVRMMLGLEPKGYEQPSLESDLVNRAMAEQSRVNSSSAA